VAAVVSEGSTVPHYPRPFFVKKRNRWYVQLDGKQINLGPEKETAFSRYHDIMAERAKNPPRAHVVGGNSSQPLVDEILDAYLDWLSHRVQEGSKAQRTFDWYHNYLQSFLDSVPGILTVDQLQPIHVYRWVDSHPNWKTGRRGAITAVQRAFNWAAKAGMLRSLGGVSPLARLDKPAQGRREQLITVGEYKKILSAVKDNAFRDLIEAAWETGARPNELFIVEASHVDREHARWVFPVVLSKGRRNQRVVYLPDKALTITLRRMVKFPDGPLFRNAHGKPWCASAVKCRFQRLKKKLGVRYSLYAFRHAFVTRALTAANLDAVTVSVLAGHRDTSMISRHYAHLTQRPDYLREAAKRASGA
jgi:integrase